MTTYGLTPQGFAVKPLETLQSDLAADLRTAFGASIPTNPQSYWGQLIGLVSDRLSELWLLCEAIYTAMDPDGASGVPLDTLCALTGTVRAPPKLSHVYAVCAGTPGTSLPTGRAASTAETFFRFASSLDATIASVSAYATSHLYAVGDWAASGGGIWQCVTGGTSVSPGPTGAIGTTYTAPDGLVWLRIGDGAGAVLVEFAATIAGSEAANAGTLSRIETPVAGWTSVYNPQDAYVLGAPLETDTQLRIDREGALRAQGNATAGAIRAAILAVSHVTGCYVFINDSDVTDGDGLLPHSIEAVVQGGANADIEAAIFASLAAGIATNGTTSGTVLDSQGVAHTIKFSRPTIVPIYITLHATVDASTYPVDGDAQIAAALLAFASADWTNGVPVRSSPLGAQAFKISGVLDVPLPFIGTAPSPGSSAEIPITLRQIAQADSSRILIGHP